MQFPKIPSKHKITLHGLISHEKKFFSLNIESSSTEIDIFVQ